MQKVNYTLTIAGWSVDSADDPRTELIELVTHASMLSPTDYCRASVYALPKPAAGLVTQGIGAAAGALGVGGSSSGSQLPIQVRGKQLQHGDDIEISFGVGDTSATVMTAQITSFAAAPQYLQVSGGTGMQELTAARLNQVYVNRSLRQIVSDLCSQVDVEMGNVATGSTYPYVVVHESKSVFVHMRELARREGLDMYFDAENKLNICPFTRTSADHIFRYGSEILRLELRNEQRLGEHILAYGESPSSNKGGNTWHWLTKDLTPFRGETGNGMKLFTGADGTIRSKDAADKAAVARWGRIQDQATLGKLTILGNPNVRLGDAVELKDAPKPELNGMFKVVSVQHIFNKQQGYLTRVGFSGKGGADAAGGLLGGAGKVAGALGVG